jgi:hypothetical protein
MAELPCICGTCDECKRSGFSRRSVLGGLISAAAVVTGTSAVAKEPVHSAKTAKDCEAEAFQNLKAMFIAQKSYFAERDRYSASLDQIGFAPDEWCEDGARLRIKEKSTEFKKVGCHFIYELETLGEGVQMQFRAYARGAVAPVLGINYLMESSGEFAGIPRRNPK